MMVSRRSPDCVAKALAIGAAALPTAITCNGMEFSIEKRRDASTRATAADALAPWTAARAIANRSDLSRPGGRVS
jgi:hypothetical protein